MTIESVTAEMVQKAVGKFGADLPWCRSIADKLNGMLAQALAAERLEREKPEKPEKPVRELLGKWRKYIRREMNSDHPVIGDDLVYCDAMRHCADELAAALEQAAGQAGAEKEMER